MPEITTLVWVAAVGFAAASLALLALAALPVRRGRASGAIGDSGIVYLFEGRRLVDATARAKRLLPGRRADGDDWASFVMTFAPRFEALEDQLADLPERTLVQLEESGPETAGMVLTAEWKDGLVRLSLEEREDAGTLPEIVERYALSAMQSELSTLRAVAEEAPALIWRQRSDGTVIWANTAYMNRAALELDDGAMMSWPPPILFPDVTPDSQPDDAPDDPGGRSPRRVMITDRVSGAQSWFKLTTSPETEDLLCFAEPIDELVKAEISLSNFLQTLTKTFAHLTVGLAVFDRKRQLALFNPALVDLSNLPSEFLSRRPTLRSFLDALRDNQRVPEPKDYKSWRMKIAQLETEAVDGTFEETWTLPTGQTYRVRGRPHPDGAVAFMFEDISSEVSLTRSFRSEIELSQSVINSLEDAVAVFSPTGTLILSNPAYAALWRMDATSALTEISISEALEVWRAACRDGGGVEALAEAALRTQGRTAWMGTLSLKNGGRLSCRLQPIGGGNTMTSFRPKVRRPAEAGGKVTQGVFMDS